MTGGLKEALKEELTCAVAEARQIALAEAEEGEEGSTAEHCCRRHWQQPCDDWAVRVGRLPWASRSLTAAAATILRCRLYRPALQIALLLLLLLLRQCPVPQLHARRRKLARAMPSTLRSARRRLPRLWLPPRSRPLPIRWAGARCQFSLQHAEVGCRLPRKRGRHSVWGCTFLVRFGSCRRGRSMHS